MAFIKAEPVQIAVVDYNMPGRDGLALTAELRAMYPDIAVAILSANAQEEIISGARQLGATFITKPLTEDALGAFLTEVSANQRK